jgi:hypothetical protein
MWYLRGNSTTISRRSPDKQHMETSTNLKLFRCITEYLLRASKLDNKLQPSAKSDRVSVYGVSRLVSHKSKRSRGGTLRAYMVVVIAPPNRIVAHEHAGVVVG